MSSWTSKLVLFTVVLFMTTVRCHFISYYQDSKTVCYVNSEEILNLDSLGEFGTGKDHLVTNEPNPKGRMTETSVKMLKNHSERAIRMYKIMKT